MNRRITLIALTTGFLSACAGLQTQTTETPEQTVASEQAVWSNDGSEVAVVQALADPTNAEHLQYQIFVRKPDGSSNRQVTDVRSEPIRQLYYVKDPDYVIAESILEGERSRFDKITLDGHEITIMEDRLSPAQICTEQSGAMPLVPHSVLPSPDGKMLAHLYNRACGQVVIEFLQAHDLSAVDGYTLAISAPAQATWHPQGYLVLALNDGKTAWKINVEQAPLSTDYPHCLHPTTSSSNIAADGRRVSILNGQLKIAQEDPQRAFGCQ